MVGSGGKGSAFATRGPLQPDFANTSATVFAIASNVLRESMRLRIATFFAGTVLVLIPLLPVWIDPNDPLRYQVQTFLSRSTGLLFFLAACLTAVWWIFRTGWRLKA